MKIITKQIKETKITVEKGSVKVNNAVIITKEKQTAIVVVDLNSKYCEVLAHGDSDKLDCECIIVDAGTQGLYLDKRYKGPTIITFDDFKNWHIVCYTIFKWTLYICLMKNIKREVMKLP